MKKLALMLVVMISFASMAQVVYVDTLKNNTTPGVTDTVVVKNLHQNYNFVSVTAENLGAVACTLSVKAGAFIKNSSNVVYDSTYWNLALTDSANAVVTGIIVPVGGVKSVLMIKHYPAVVKTYITNTTGGYVRVITEGTKEK